MNAFLSGLISIILLFSFCFTISACFYKILLIKKQKPKQPQRKRKRRPSEVIYYIESEEPKPKKQTIAIKGTLLNKAEMNKIIKKSDD